MQATPSAKKKRIFCKEEDLEVPILFTQETIAFDFGTNKLSIADAIYLIFINILNITDFPEILVWNLKDEALKCSYAVNNRRLMVMKKLGIYFYRRVDMDRTSYERQQKLLQKNHDFSKISVRNVNCEDCEAALSSTKKFDESEERKFRDHFTKDHLQRTKEPTPLFCPDHGQVFVNYKTSKKYSKVIFKPKCFCSSSKNIKIYIEEKPTALTAAEYIAAVDKLQKKFDAKNKAGASLTMDEHSLGETGENNFSSTDTWPVVSRSFLNFCQEPYGEHDMDLMDLEDEDASAIAEAAAMTNTPTEKHEESKQEDNVMDCLEGSNHYRLSPAQSMAINRKGATSTGFEGDEELTDTDDDSAAATVPSFEVPMETSEAIEADF